MSEGLEIEIKNTKLIVSIDGLTPLEINGLAQKIGDEMTKIEEEMNIVDTYKQLLIVTLNMSAENYLEGKNRKIIQEADCSKLDSVIKKLKKNLDDETLF